MFSEKLIMVAIFFFLEPVMDVPLKEICEIPKEHEQFEKPSTSIVLSTALCRFENHCLSLTDFIFFNAILRICVSVVWLYCLILVNTLKWRISL